MRRTLILTVDNDRANQLVGEFRERVMTPEAGGRAEYRSIKRLYMDVPPDDQLTRDLDEVTHALKKRTGLSPEREDMALFDACRRVRAAAGLDEGADDD